MRTLPPLAELPIVRPRPEEMPWDLLLEADPSRERVEGYLDPKLMRIVKYEAEILGVYVLARREATRFELMNIAVRADCRQQGLGRWLLGHAIGLAETKGGRVVEVGTGNSSLDALAFYQRAGFRIVGVVRDFFVDNYPAPIVENGIRCRDMIRLELILEPE
jgi:ribosomal protein S18 acetylase RimI-like enzyme